jgi:DUF4097 and DUF4098 domain-containing protein YvlB
MKRALILICTLAIILGLCSCTVSCDVQGKTMVDGVELDYENNTEVLQSYNIGHMEIDVGSGDVAVNGVSDAQVNLKVSYREYEPGDARILFKNGKLSYETKSGKPALITGVTGTIPQNIALSIDTGSGNVAVSDMRENKELELDTGSGKVVVSNCMISVFDADTGSGDVHILDSSITDFKADTGSGEINIVNSRIKDAEIETGSGDIRLTDSEILTRRFEIGFGQVIEHSLSD